MEVRSFQVLGQQVLVFQSESDRELSVQVRNKDGSFSRVYPINHPEDFDCFIKDYRSIAAKLISDNLMFTSKTLRAGDKNINVRFNTAGEVCIEDLAEFLGLPAEMIKSYTEAKPVVKNNKVYFTAKFNLPVKFVIHKSRSHIISEAASDITEFLIGNNHSKFHDYLEEKGVQLELLREREAYTVEQAANLIQDFLIEQLQDNGTRDKTFD